MAGHIQKKGNNWYVVIEQGRDAEDRRIPPKWISVKKELGLNKPATKTQARELLINLLAEKQKGSLIHPVDITISDYLSYWLDNYQTIKDLSDNTIKQYGDNIRLHIKPYFGKTKLSKVAPLTIQSLLTEKQKTLSQNSVFIIYKVLKIAFKMAVRWEYIARDPMERVTAPTVSKPQVESWTEEEVSKFLDVAYFHPFYSLFLTALTTGMRKSELLFLKWENVNIKKNTIAVVNAKTKAGDRIIDVSPKTMDAILAVRKGNANVFLSHADTPICQNSPNNILDKLIKKAKVTRITFHGLRHTHATILLARGEEARVVADRLGHANIATLYNTYAHVLPRKQKEAACKMDDLF